MKTSSIWHPTLEFASAQPKGHDEMMAFNLKCQPSNVLLSHLTCSTGIYSYPMCVSAILSNVSHCDPDFSTVISEGILL